MRNGVISLALVLAAVPAGTMLASDSAQAQVSQGHKFLEAVRKKDLEAVKTMLGSSGSKSTPGTIIINAQDVTTGDSALHVVINRRDVAWLRYLIGNQANVNIRNNQGTTPLWLAVNSNFIDGAFELIKGGARVNDPGPAGETPLISAVHQKNLELARALIAAGADANKADNSGRTAVDYAQLSVKGTALGNEIELAGKAAKAKKTKTYGPML